VQYRAILSRNPPGLSNLGPRTALLPNTEAYEADLLRRERSRSIRKHHEHHPQSHSRRRCSRFIFSPSSTLEDGTTPASLESTSTLQGGGTIPGWLLLDSASGSLLVSDESELATVSPVLSDLQVNVDNGAQVDSGAAGSTGRVHSTFYGGVDGKGFEAVAH
jgi:hypothetical protein